MSSDQSLFTPQAVDPRSPRFGAGITSAVLALTALLGPVWGLPPLILQTLAFGGGSIFGLAYQPYGWVYRRFVQPKLAPPTELEDARPPRFAQTVGLVFAVAGLIGAVFSLPLLFYIAVGLALVAALLNAVFDFCLGCEIYLLSKRAFANPSVSGANS